MAQGLPKRIFESLLQKKIFRVGRLKEKMASDLHRTATTTYLCYVPILEDSAGAGRVGLAVAKIHSFYICASGKAYKYYSYIAL